MKLNSVIRVLEIIKNILSEKIMRPVAQFGRASEYESGGLRFESLQVVKWECAGVGEPGQTVNLMSYD